MTDRRAIEFATCVPMLVINGFSLYRALRHPYAALGWPALFLLALWLLAIWYDSLYTLN